MKPKRKTQMYSEPVLYNGSRQHQRGKMLIEEHFTNKGLSSPRSVTDASQEVYTLWEDTPYAKNFIQTEPDLTTAKDSADAHQRAIDENPERSNASDYIRFEVRDPANKAIYATRNQTDLYHEQQRLF